MMNPGAIQTKCDIHALLRVARKQRLWMGMEMPMASAAGNLINPKVVKDLPPAAANI